MTFETNGLSRKERERQSRRNAMLDAAKAVLAERGYAGATLEEIAARAEFGKGTLYNYFPGGKEEILVAIFDQLYVGLCELISAAFDDADERPFEEVMHGFVVSCFQFFYERFNLFMILVKEAERLIFSHNAEKVAYFARQQDEVIDTLAGHLARAMERGELREMSPHLLAHMLVVNIKGCQVQYCPRQRGDVVPRTEKAPEELARFVTDLILHGVAVSSTTPRS